MNDPIVDEIHRVRTAILEEQDNDIDKLFAYCRKRREVSGRDYIDLSSKPTEQEHQNRRRRPQGNRDEAGQS